MSEQKRAIKCTIHGLPRDLIPLVLAESHIEVFEGIFYFVNLKDFSLHDGLDGWFTVKSVDGMSATPNTPAGDDGMFSMQHEVWNSDHNYGDGEFDNMLTTEEMVERLNRANFEFTEKNNSGRFYEMTFEVV